jgi:hypothetical protein
MAAGAAKHLTERGWDRWILTLGLAIKLLWERFFGADQAFVVIDAHLYGALCGFLVGAALSLRIVIIRHRWRRGT